MKRKIYSAIAVVMLCCSCSGDRVTEVQSEKPVFVIPSRGIGADGAKSPVIRFNSSKDTCADERKIANEQVAEQWYRNLIRWADSSPFGK